LKRDQSLLVEFQVFPSKLIELIELCLNSNTSSCSNNQNQKQQDYTNSSIQSTNEFNSLFTANLEMSTGVFSVIESNRFKQLTHISLQLRPGTDTAIKGYLSSRLAYITTVAIKSNADLKSVNTNLSEQTVENAGLIKELNKLRSVDMYAYINVWEHAYDIYRN
jgi:spindle assembly abnormal protein 6